MSIDYCTGAGYGLIILLDNESRECLNGYLVPDHDEDEFYDELIGGTLTIEGRPLIIINNSNDDNDTFAFIPRGDDMDYIAGEDTSEINKDVKYSTPWIRIHEPNEESDHTLDVIQDICDSLNIFVRRGFVDWMSIF